MATKQRKLQEILAGSKSTQPDAQWKTTVTGAGALGPVKSIVEVPGS